MKPYLPKCRHWWRRHQWGAWEEARLTFRAHSERSIVADGQVRQCLWCNKKDVRSYGDGLLEEGL